MRLGKRRTIFKTKDCITCKLLWREALKRKLDVYRTMIQRTVHTISTCSTVCTVYAATHTHGAVWPVQSCCVDACTYLCVSNTPLHLCTLSCVLPPSLIPPFPSPHFALPLMPSDCLFSGKLYKNVDFVEERHRHRYEVHTQGPYCG